MFGKKECVESAKCGLEMGMKYIIDSRTKQLVWEVESTSDSRPVLITGNSRR